MDTFTLDLKVEITKKVIGTCQKLRNKVCNVEVTKSSPHAHAPDRELAELA